MNVMSARWPTYCKGNVTTDHEISLAACRAVNTKLLYRYVHRDLDQTETGRLEIELAEFFGVNHALAVSTGTASPSLSLMAQGIGVGDGVLCSTSGFPASQSSICSTYAWTRCAPSSRIRDRLTR